MNKREFTQLDLDYQTQLIALQEEQAGLSTRTKAGRMRRAEITNEFFRLKDEWLRVCGPTHTL